MTPITYPARPINGGPLDQAPEKSGVWYYEPKYNGWRALVNAYTGEMWNRHGNLLSIGNEFKAALHKLEELAVVSFIEWWDVEALERRHNIGKGCLVVLDWVPTPSLPGKLPPPAWWNRNQFMHEHIAELDLTPPAAFPLLSIPPVISGTNYAWNDLQAINKRLGCDFYEGLVAKRADSIYPIQLRSPKLEFPFWVKHRWAY